MKLKIDPTAQQSAQAVMPKDQDWFEMPLIRKRRFATATWTPLRISEWIEKTGEYGFVGHQEEFFGAATLAVVPARRKEIQELSWTHLGIGRDQGVFANRESNGYKPVDIYQYNDGDDLGLELVLVQHFNREEPSVWHLHQDLVFALRLKREGDSWVRPDEDYCEVVRLRRNAEARPLPSRFALSFFATIWPHVAWLCAYHLIVNEPRFVRIHLI